VLENQHKRSIKRDVENLRLLMPWIGHLTLERVHMGTLQPWIEYRREQGRTPGTINHGLKIVRRVLNLAASEWLDEHGMTWLANAPKIRLLPDRNKRQPWPMSWDEQNRLFQKLPPHLASMALLYGEHRMSRCRGLQAAMGLGSAGSATEHVGVHCARLLCEKR